MEGILHSHPADAAEVACPDLISLPPLLLSSIFAAGLIPHVLRLRLPLLDRSTASHNSRPQALLVTPATPIAVGQQAVAALAQTCRAWAEAVRNHIQAVCSWNVDIHDHPELALSSDQWLAVLTRRRIRSLELPGVASCPIRRFISALLTSPAFIATSAGTLQRIECLPDSCAHLLAAHFRAVERVSLLDDKGALPPPLLEAGCFPAESFGARALPPAGLTDTDAQGRPGEPGHSAAMRLAALAGLPRLAALEVLYGIVELADTPPSVASLALTETDRLLLLGAGGGGGRAGATVVDMLLEQLEQQGEGGGGSVHRWVGRRRHV